MNIKTFEEIKNMQISGQIAANILDQLIDHIKPGIKTIEIEHLSQQLIEKYQVKGAFKGYNGYKYNTCISVNDEIVHGLPGNRIIKDGDIVSLDFGVIYKDMYSDLAKTIIIGKSDDKKQVLLDITQNALNSGINKIKPGVFLGDIQYAISQIILNANLGLVRDLTGHGIGKDLQEKPSIPNYGKPGSGIVLKSGMAFCLEPMVTMGSGDISVSWDGWTIVSADHTLSAHFEHTLLVTDSGFQILTLPKY